MAEYEFECRNCEKTFTLFMRVSERKTTAVRCPKCGSDDVESLMQAFFAKTMKKG
jgi:putative FmdB family regulatory protein